MLIGASAGSPTTSITSSDVLSITARSWLCDITRHSGGIVRSSEVRGAFAGSRLWSALTWRAAAVSDESVACADTDTKHTGMSNFNTETARQLLCVMTFRPLSTSFANKDAGSRVRGKWRDH